MIDGEELETTPEHPFYVEGEGWVQAEDLQLGDDIRNADGSTGEVQSITTEETSQEMYNLTVAEAHTFFVGDGQWLVHNDTCDVIRQIMAQENLSWNDVDHLRELTKMDIESTGAEIIYQKLSGGQSGQTLVLTGDKLPTVLISPYAHRATIIHEWVHFDWHRQLNWPTRLPERIDLQNDIFSYTWQLKNRNVILLPDEYSWVEDWQKLLNSALQRYK